MPPMDYYRRYRQDGSCEIICVSCFATVGVAPNASVASTLEAEHDCPRKNGEKKDKTIGADSPALETDLVQKQQPSSTWHSSTHSWESQLFTIATIVLLLYFIPTAAERIALDHANIWIACILPGDLTGCIYLGTVLRKPRLGAGLYLLLTILEASLFMDHLLPARSLFWVVDIVPTLVVMGFLLHSRGTTNSRTVALP
jgi:hypothetical protein